MIVFDRGMIMDLTPLQNVYYNYIRSLGEEILYFGCEGMQFMSYDLKEMKGKHSDPNYGHFSMIQNDSADVERER